MTDQLDDIAESITINAPRNKVWRAIIEPDSVAQWLGCLQFRPEVGSLFYMQQDQKRRNEGDIEGATHCEVLRIDEEEQIVFSWFVPGTPETKVAIRLSDAPESKTVVQLVHGGWDQFSREAVESIWSMLRGGWKSFVLPALKYLVESK